MRLVCSLWAALALAAAAQPRVVKHVVVYKEAGRYGGWPANHGVWSWGNEILVGFSSATFQLKTPDRHQYDGSQPERPYLARSADGGESWKIERPASLLPPEQGGKAAIDLPAPMNFADANFAMTLRFVDKDTGPSRLWYTMDRGATWQGPYAFPQLGQPGIAARTDYLVDGPREATIFLTAAKSDGKEGRVLCARTEDGGKEWKFVSWVGGEPSGFSIQPSSVRISPKEILTATRVKIDEETTGIEVYRSRKNGELWALWSRPVVWAGPFAGNPPSLIRLKDGRLCLTYGVRSAPYRICARLSSNDGKTWSDEIVLRNDGAMWDLGYVRSVQRADGNVVTIYYFPEQPHTERIIAATIWEPGAR